jgi:hypothetical protein
MLLTCRRLRTRLIKFISLTLCLTLIPGVVPVSENSRAGAQSPTATAQSRQLPP